MQEYEFQLILPPGTGICETLANDLFEAGCDDAMLFSTSGTTAVGFTREAESLEQAVRSAIADVLKAGQQVVRAELLDEQVIDSINSELAAGKT